LVALSGGPDSVALLQGAVSALRPLGVEVSACWVDHAIRPVAELAAERSFVEGLCAELRVDLLVERAARGEIERTAPSLGGVEAAARRFRYDALERARAASSCDVVLTGHNSDDQVETMIMRFCTGSGAAGLRGIPAATGFVRRPLLGVTRAEILSYLDSEGRSFREDSTNGTDEYLRNRVRHNVVPILAETFPSLRSALETSSGKARIDEDALEGYVDGLFGAGASGPRAPGDPLPAETLPGDPLPGETLPGETLPGIGASAFFAAPLAVRIRALYRLCTHSVPGSGRLPWRLALAAASSEKRSGRLASGAGVDFTVDDGRVLALPAGGSHGSRPRGADAAGPGFSGFGFLARGPGDYRIGKGLLCRIYLSDRPEGIRIDAFSWPLWIRSRRAGDELRTGCGRKMVDSLLSELGVPASLRDAVPIVEDSEGIVAVCASAHGARDAYRRNDGLAPVPATGFLVLEMKGAAHTDAIRR